MESRMFRIGCLRIGELGQSIDISALIVCKSRMFVFFNAVKSGSPPFSVSNPA